jgi:MSHA biogenesis protein MshO
MMTSRPHRSAGFTLIEIVMVIVVIGIISGMIAIFVAKPVLGYIDAAHRAELTDSADVALRRLTRDVRLALPNSLRVMTSGGNHYIEFIMTTNGGRYRDTTDGSTAGNFLSWTSANLTFDVLGPMPSNPALAVNDYIVVYNLGTGYAPADAYAAADPCTNCNRAKVSGISANVVTLATNPFAGQSPPLPSPNARFQIVPGGTKAVTYVCPTTTAGNLSRYANYGFNATQAVPSGTPSTLAANATCTVDYTPTATGRNGLLYIELKLTDSTSGESVTLFQQIHVDNAP